MSSHTHVNCLTSLLRRLGLLKTRLLVARESTMIFERAFSPLKTRALRAMYALYGRHDRIICQTEQMQESLGRHTGATFAKQTITIGNPISLPEISAAAKRPAGLTVPMGEPTMVWCGRFHSIKRPELAIEVLRSLSKQGGASPHLLMLGTGAQVGQAQDLIAEHGLGEICTLAGYHQNPPSVFASIPRGIGLLTSEIEGFPNVVLEMLAAGLNHVVVTPCCASLSSVPGVTVARSHDVDDIVAAIRSTMNGPVDRPLIDAHLASRDIGEYARRAFAPPRLDGVQQTSSDSGKMKQP